MSITPVMLLERALQESFKSNTVDVSQPLSEVVHLGRVENWPPYFKELQIARALVRKATLEMYPVNPSDTPSDLVKIIYFNAIQLAGEVES